jgi:hypothetical protein
MHKKTLLGKSEGRDLLEDLGVDGRILGKQGGKVWTG